MTFRKRNKTKFSLEIAFSKKWKAIVVLTEETSQLLRHKEGKSLAEVWD